MNLCLLYIRESLPKSKDEKMIRKFGYEKIIPNLLHHLLIITFSSLSLILFFSSSFRPLSHSLQHISSAITHTFLIFPFIIWSSHPFSSFNNWSFSIFSHLFSASSLTNWDISPWEISLYFHCTLTSHSCSLFHSHRPSFLTLKSFTLTLCSSHSLQSTTSSHFLQICRTLSSYVNEKRIVKIVYLSNNIIFHSENLPIVFFVLVSNSLEENSN